MRYVRAWQARQQVGFVPRLYMTQWLDPISMIKVLWRMIRTKDVRSNWSRHADDPLTPFDYSQWDDEEFWFDYAADMGDGFDATMAVAWHLGRTSVKVDAPEKEKLTTADSGSGQTAGQTKELPRGRLLILGGDLVYPTASDRRYRNQLVGPYQLGWESTKKDPENADDADVLAIPGNHDWYGGLAAFSNVFCHGKKLGGWQTRQQYSWWATPLPHNWWVFGIDTALNGRVSENQYEYFAEVVEAMPVNARVIACVPTPLYRLKESNAKKLKELEDFFEQLGVHPEVYIAGDRHLFAVHKRQGVEDGFSTSNEPHVGVSREGSASQQGVEWHITSGGGGAYQHPVHNLSASVPDFPDASRSGSSKAPFSLIQCWPSPDASRSSLYRWGGLIWGRASARVVSGFMLLHLLFAFSAGSSRPPEDVSVVGLVASVVSGYAVVGLALIFFISIAAARSDSTVWWFRIRARGVGALHGLVQVAAFVSGVSIGTVMALAWGGGSWSNVQAWLWLIVGSFVGAAVSLLFLVEYLRRSNLRYRMNDNSTYSVRASGDNRHFCRFRIGSDGSLQLFVVGIERVGSNWLEAIIAGNKPPRDMSEPQLVSTVVHLPGSDLAASVSEDSVSKAGVEFESTLV